jgi:hypothetical protein
MDHAWKKQVSSEVVGGEGGKCWEVGRVLPCEHYQCFLVILWILAFASSAGMLQPLLAC